MSAAEKKTAFRIATVLGTMHALANNSNTVGPTKSDIAQKLKRGNIFWKIPMKIPVNRHYYNRKCRFCAKPKQRGGVRESTFW